jgi:hypothetical protein
VPVLSLTPRRFLLWIMPIARDGEPYLHLAEIHPDHVSPPDTVAMTTDQSTEYSGAASAHRRWVARSQQRSGEPGFTVRVLYSDTVRMWREVARQGVDEDHCVIAPLSDRSAMLVTAGASGLSWAILEGLEWTRRGNLDPRRFAAAHPRLRFRPSGGLWLLWTERRRVHVSFYQDGQWQRGDSLNAIHPPGQTFWPSWCDMSRDTADRPVLAWSDLGYGYTYRDVTCIAFPTDSGWTPGEEVPGSTAGYDPAVTRDRNGDAWVAWWGVWGGGVWFTHTYVSATTSAPRFDGSQRTPIVRWTLSEPAPETWWVVLRAAGAGEFEPVARVRAGTDLEMSWTDTTAPANAVLRYRIRRESVDRRYEWTSEEAPWMPRGPALSLSLKGRNPGSARIELSLAGAEAGPVDVRLYDLQGRLVHRQRAEAGGSGQDSITLDLAAATPRIRTGIYFAKVSDRGGRGSDPLKLVVLW